MTGLLGAEVRRFRSRRFVLVLLLLSLLGFGAGVTVAALQHRTPTSADLQQAQVRIDQFLKEAAAGREQCLTQVPPGQAPDQFCGTAPVVQELRAEDFTDVRPFVLADQLPNGAIGIGVLTAVLLFLIGATWVGAEWSTRSMVALLFWEPRRVRVVTTKLGVLLLAATGIGVVAQLLWFGAAQLLSRTRGTTAGLPGAFYGNVLQTELRAVLFGIIAAALGFALANLVRNTGAALGIAFAYLLVVENAVRALYPRWQGWLLTTSAGALLDPAGGRYYLAGRPDGLGNASGREVVVTHLHGGLVLGGTALVLVALGSVLFVRRDLH